MTARKTEQEQLQGSVRCAQDDESLGDASNGDGNSYGEQLQR
jgi:hypothetical protein